MFTNLDEIKKAGFAGFKTINQLCADNSLIPQNKGVYLIINSSTSNNDFLTIGTGGFFKTKDPNVSLTVLSNKWVDNSLVVYIGQAGGNGSSATLKSRIKQYLQFGKGKPVGHYGGRYIWQLKNNSELIVAWKSLNTENPSAVEQELFRDFLNYYGRLPFANLKM